jgi:tetratricopeptide (TPR) repeat protein
MNDHPTPLGGTCSARFDPLREGDPREDVLMAVSRPTVVMRASLPLAMVGLLQFVSWAGARYGGEEQYRQAMGEVQRSKARLEMILLPEVLRHLEASEGQVERIRAVLSEMNAQYARKYKEIRREAYESDSSGPREALEMVPDLRSIVSDAYPKVLRVLSAKQSKALQAVWDEADKKAKEDMKSKEKKYNNQAIAHYNLGVALQAKGQVDEAIACYRKALQLDPNVAQAHNNLGNALQAKGQVVEAIACYHKAIDLDPKHIGFRTNLAQAERLAAAREKLPAFQKGSYTPASNDERLGLAEWCRIKKMHHAATRLYAAAFVADPKLADDLGAAHRYNAACHAALAATGQGEDAAKLDDKERARLREQALDWLRADLTLRRKQLVTDKPADRAAVQQVLRHWQTDSDLAGLRDQAALAKLSAEERAACAELWAEVAALRTKSAEKAK